MDPSDSSRKSNCGQSTPVRPNVTTDWNTAETNPVDSDKLDTPDHVKKEDDIELQLNISKKPIHIPEFQYDKYYFQLKVAQAKESTEFIELLTAMSPGNATDVQKLTEQIEVPSSLLPPIEKGRQNFKKKEKTIAARNKANRVVKLKSDYIKMRQQDTDLRQQIGLLEAELAEAQAKLKASMSEGSKMHSFPRSGSTRRHRNKELKPLIVPKPANNGKKVILAILPKSTMNELTQKSKSLELPALIEKKDPDEMKTCTPKKIGKKSEKVNIGEHIKLPDISRHSNHGPYFKDCSIVYRNSVKTPVISKKDHNAGNTEYFAISHPLDRGEKPKVVDSEVNVSQNSRFLPPITQEQNKVAKTDNLQRSVSKEVKLPDIYAPKKKATPPEKNNKVPNVFAKLKKAKVYPQD